MQERVLLDGGPLTRAQVVAVARDGAGVGVSADALAAVAATRAHVERLADAESPTYGVSTGFGALAVRHIPSDRRTALQRSLIRSHAAGAGPKVETEVVRALMLLRLRTLATARTGVRASTVEALAAMLDAGITPSSPSSGRSAAPGTSPPLRRRARAHG
ncbi:aromatic amino acid lyase [Actinokineospora soli]|uniref:Aromatic amino acid lyase n=1 Tax=Actinokineospora soli TaxID=1048753 RepID=A0ABW2TVN9_9PSEU